MLNPGTDDLQQRLANQQPNQRREGIANTKSNHDLKLSQTTELQRTEPYRHAEAVEAQGKS
jgi:hypothetical protein